MATKEFYIRSASETDARGPFTIEQLLSLAETGGVTPETLYYEAMEEKWVVISDNTELFVQIFPEKKKLTLKKDQKITSLNKPNNELQASIEVTDMLAAAEGRTHETADKSYHLVMADRCAKFGLWGMVLTMLLAMSAEVFPSIDGFLNFTPAKLLESPLVILGVVDLVIALFLLLGIVALYPVVRFRAMLGLGFFGFVYYTQGQPLHLAAAIAGSVGLYILTIFLSYVPIGLGLLLGIGGMGTLAYMAIF